MYSIFEVPRLTGCLRACTEKFADDEEFDYKSEILNRIRLSDDEERRQWRIVCEHAKLNGKFGLVQELRRCAIACLKDEADECTIISVALFLYNLFKNTEVVRVSDSSSLRERFGNIDSKLAQRICSVVSKLARNDAVVTTSAECSDGCSVIFGNAINVQVNIQSDASAVPFNHVELPDSVFGMRTTTVLADNFTVSNGSEIATENVDFDENYIDEHLQSFGEFGDDLKKVIFESLLTCTDDELQETLLNVMGLEHVDFVSFVICNKAAILKRNLMKKITNDIRKSSTNTNILSPRVTIQTKEESLALKQMRKDEKKRKQKKQENETDAVRENDISLMQNSSSYQSLQAARSKPLFSNNEETVPNYPFVFDRLAEIKRNSFLCSDKLLLPESAEKSNTEFMERIHLPAPKSAYENLVGSYPLISVSSLNETLRMVFSGIDKLNYIQSVVFHGASESNENLLVCAPTGAGKTNVALLCIASEISKNIHEGVLRKEKFKIVYITPMKALAAEIVNGMKKRLSRLGVIVRELTGDMQLSKREIAETQFLVTTPEKWDVITRKGSTDEELTRLVKLVIIDEIHLLNDDRGAVIECIVARTLKQVEQTQTMIRIVGLSATLPNYLDVAKFLRVNLETGLYYFDDRFRPVPLDQTFIGIKAANKMQLIEYMDEACYREVRRELIKKNQVIVFVHARNATKRTADVLLEKARNKNELSYFQSEKFSSKDHKISHAHSRHLIELVSSGLAIHHAGLARSDRDIVESYFRQGIVRVLVCTATLAWGVNLPAHAVIIKGTQIYDSKRSAFVDMSILDILQIFGRAGRPQFDTSGHGIIITPHEKLYNYLRLVMNQNPIESQLIKSLADSLNAEIVLGNVGNIDEGVSWLGYTYLYVRMLANPLAYGINYRVLRDDPRLEKYCRALIVETSRCLDKSYMIRFNEKTGFVHSTDLGRIASHYYISHPTIEIINEKLIPTMNESELLWLVTNSSEFSQIKVREDEMEELEALYENDCKLPVYGGVENNYGKTNILMQSYIARSVINNFSLSSDMNYIQQNAVRIMRALFEIAVKNNLPVMASRCLNMSKTLEQRIWFFSNALRQIDRVPIEAILKLEEKKVNVQTLFDLSAQEIGAIIHHMRMGDVIKECCAFLPKLEAEATVQPITRSILRINLTLTPCFKWNDALHGTQGELYWVWVEDPNTDFMYYAEQILITRKQVKMKENVNMVFAIPISEPLPSQYIVRCLSNKWIDCDTSCLLTFKHLILPERHLPHTNLLDLDPLPVKVLRNSGYESFYKYSHFNPIQTQVFHCVYHTDNNILLGAPTGSGKTVIAELAIFRLFDVYPGMKTVYIAPLKALVRERLTEWREKFQKINKLVVELTGDVTPDVRSINESDIIITTPEKWDGISRSWQTRTYVRQVGLLIIDEIHLLGEDRGPVLEVIVSRMNFVSSHTEKKVRIIGLSTAVANAVDLADWLSIKKIGLYNFKPSVRPVPLEVHISGFPGKHYCPRMATMNKPAFQAIKTYSNNKPVLIFVSSRRQTRLTALELISHLAATGDSKQWVHAPENELNNFISSINDTNLQLTLAFGIGIHHAGLAEKDRKLVEELFVQMKIQVLVATSTLAWGVNFPAHLVVIKGTEYYDGKTRRYVDFPITDVLQMMGRAGRPQFDDQGVAVVMVQDSKKDFYKKFLYEPFPVESSLLNVLSDHLNAEIVSGTVNTKQEAIDYLTWTYFFRRILVNPSYYGLQETDQKSLNSYLSSLIERSVVELKWSHCIEVGEDDRSLTPTVYGRIASYYYLSHETIRLFMKRLTANTETRDLIRLISDVKEYAELPVRHNEDQLNCALAKELNCTCDSDSFDSPHVKTLLLLHAHFSRVKLPVSDYYTDLKSVLDQVLRIMQGLLDIAADFGWLRTALRVVNVMQMSIQARWIDDSSLLSVTGIDSESLRYFCSENVTITSLPQLISHCEKDPNFLEHLESKGLAASRVRMIRNAIRSYPQIECNLSVTGRFARKKEVETRNIDDIVWKTEALQLYVDEEYALNVHLVPMNRSLKRTRKAIAPFFSKPKEEGWIGMIGDIKSCELWALKRIHAVRKNVTSKLMFITPMTPGHYEVSFFLMSDCYLGLDQQFNFLIEVNKSDIVYSGVLLCTLCLFLYEKCWLNHGFICAIQIIFQVI